MKPTEDLEHWQNLLPPLCPNDYEVEMYKHHTTGCGIVGLLGMTNKLQKICNFMVDLNPIPQTKPVIKCDWNDLNECADVIIGDGVLNLEGLQLADKLLDKYQKLVCRVFLKKFSWMKYATHFPQEFPNAKLVIPTQDDIAIVVWEK